MKIDTKYYLEGKAYIEAYEAAIQLEAANRVEPVHQQPNTKRREVMIRCRFKTKSDDYRPINWPIKHPYWCSGEGDDYFILIAYADDEAEIMENWPEAYDLDSEERAEYLFTERFPKPDWFQPTPDKPADSRED